MTKAHTLQIIFTYDTEIGLQKQAPDQLMMFQS